MNEPVAPQVTIDDFTALDIRVGTVTRAEPFPKARRPAFRLWIDFGELGTRKSSAQITALYRVEELVGRQVLAVVNFPPRQVADFMSEVLVLGLTNADGEVVLVQPDRDVKPGLRLS
ncbi:tRNA-binding protein [Stackebrandtia nassauensis]|uniref:Export-related chaperone CsaA n=1 Tax=Stackebrandtia nassauensis (strain DSM 44728 / CIP 108903 / NRRL B-16338 / NBRC 102104 / LLR-40K-21) TaxID=446470 RepID=D3Q6B1_STANL|nr:tRNA-binding protein [Stackebrandtia nassauensis]ADD42286.1 export-related chaperone CsaA [Stackebrandtia nassauensis DSM 44728]